MVIVPNEGKLYWLKLALKDTVPADLKFLLKLFTNNLTITRDTVLADITEATYAGYLARELARDQWTDPVISADHAQSSYTSTWQIWSSTSGTQNIWGWYLADEDDNFCLGIEKFPAFVVLSPTVPVVIRPTLRLQSETDPG